jgi:hypothetical protein
MDVLKRTAAVACAPVAAAWFVTSIMVGVGCLVVSAAGATVYAAGKYVVTGKCYNPDPMFETILDMNRVITNAPLVFLYGQKKPEEPVPVVPHTFDDMKAAQAAAIQAKQRDEILAA